VIAEVSKTPKRRACTIYWLLGGLVIWTSKYRVEKNPLLFLL